MATSKQIVPQINANDETVTLVAMAVSNGERVTLGQQLCVLETSKTALEIEAEHDGFVFFLREKGEELRVGETLCVFSSSPDVELEDFKPKNKDSRPISDSAKGLMESLQITAEELPAARLITQKLIEEYHLASSNQTMGFDLSERSLVLYCAGAHAEVVYDAVTSNGAFDVVGFVDYSGQIDAKEIFGLPIFSRFMLPKLIEKGMPHFHVNTNSIALTIDVADQIKSGGGNLANIFHSTSVVSPSAVLEENIFCGANAIVGPGAKVGAFTKILNGASVAHHATIGKHCQLSDGCRIAGSTWVGDECVIGLNSSINSKVRVGRSTTVASCKNVFNDLDENSFYV